MATLKNNELVFGGGSLDNTKGVSGHLFPYGDAGLYYPNAPTDFNSFTRPGIWEVHDPTANAPVSSSASWDNWWTLIVLPCGSSNNGYSMQVAIKMKTSTFYVRSCDGGTWSAWKTITAT